MTVEGSYRIAGIRYRHLNGTITTLNLAKRLQRVDPNFMTRVIAWRKPENPATETVLDPITEKLRHLVKHRNDRKYPLESVRLDSFNREHGAGIDKATIHVGVDADEYARALGALAVVAGTDIYFRSGAYKPETEEGRKTIAHELTHVEQHRENRITKNADRDELEKEAESAEAAETGEDPDPPELVIIGGRRYMLTKSQQVEAASMKADIAVDMLEEQSILLHEREYIKILAGLEKKLTDPSPFFYPATPANRRMDRLFRKELAERLGVFIT